MDLILVPSWLINRHTQVSAFDNVLFPGLLSAKYKWHQSLHKHTLSPLWKVKKKKIILTL